MGLYKYNMCYKLVDETNNQLFCCLSVRGFEPKILIKVYILHMLEKLFNRKLIVILSRKIDIHIVNLKQHNSTTFYPIFKMGSCRKPEIQKYKHLPKITKLKG